MSIQIIKTQIEIMFEILLQVGTSVLSTEVVITIVLLLITIRAV